MWGKGDNGACEDVVDMSGKGFYIKKRKVSELENILGYKRLSERLERVTLSMSLEIDISSSVLLEGIWKERELRERVREPG